MSPVKLKPPSPPTVSFTITIVPRFVFVNVQVTVSPAWREMAPTVLPSSHVALVRSHAGDGFVSDTPYVPGTRLPNVWLPEPDEVVIENEPKSPVNENCPFPPIACFTITIVPRFVFSNVQVTDSPGLTTIAPTGLPSLHVADVRSQPALESSETPYVPGTTE